MVTKSCSASVFQEGPVGALRLELCLSTLEACCQLQHGQMLQVSGTAKKQGNHLKKFNFVNFRSVTLD